MKIVSVFIGACLVVFAQTTVAYEVRPAFTSLLDLSAPSPTEEECEFVRSAVEDSGGVTPVKLMCPQVLAGPACVDRTKAEAVLAYGLATPEAMQIYESRAADGLPDCGFVRRGRFFVLRKVAEQTVCDIPFVAVETFAYYDEPGHGPAPYFTFILPARTVESLDCQEE